jgi:hypothetical protein
MGFFLLNDLLHQWRAQKKDYDGGNLFLMLVSSLIV